MIRWLLALVLLALPATAQELPALFSVHGVASDDVLNIRSEPSAQSEIIGMLMPDASGIEVVSKKNGWGQINTAERSGWVSLGFMRRESGQTDETLLERLFCGGTEPFWSAGLIGYTLEFEVLGEEPITYASRQVAQAQGRLDKFGASWTATTSQASAVVTRARCSDGMSGRTYGLGIDLIVQPVSGEARLYSGCCNLR